MRAIYLFYFHPLATIPGPKSWIFSRLPFALAIRNGFLPRTIKNLHATYGPAVRVAPDEVYFADGQAWSDIFAASGQEKFPKNPTWFKKHQNGSHTLHSAPNEKHAELRRILAPSFSVRRLREQEPIIQATVGRFIAQLRRKAMEGSTINMKDWFNYLSFDIVGHLTFSQSFGCLERDSYHPWVNALQKYFKFLTFATTARFFPFLEFIVTRLIPKSLWSKRQKHLSHVQKIVTARVKEGKDGGHTDLLACVRQSRGELRLSDQDVEALISIMVLAGSEGTATSLLSILHHLLDAQQDLSRLILEVRSAFKDDAEIEMDALADLPFLNAVINEALRMSPSVPAHLTRVVPYPGASICGCWLPAEVRDLCLITKTLSAVVLVLTKMHPDSRQHLTACDVPLSQPFFRPRSISTSALAI